jgi:hypothetical protein
MAACWTLAHPARTPDDTYSHERATPMRAAPIPILCTVVLLVLVSSSPMPAQQLCATHRVSTPCVASHIDSTSTVAGWQVQATPYVWALSIVGTTGLGDLNAHVDVTFRDIVEHLKAFFFGSAAARHGRWGFEIDVQYLEVEDRSITPPPPSTGADYIAKQSMVEFGALYSSPSTRPFAVDVLAGGRWWLLRNTLKLSSPAQPATDLQLNEGWVDPFVGMRLSADVSPRLFLQVHGDVGGFGAGSRFTWQALGTVGYKIGSRWTMRAGYRDVDIDFKDDDKQFRYDVGYRGPIVSASYRF